MEDGGTLEIIKDQTTSQFQTGTLYRTLLISTLFKLVLLSPLGWFVEGVLPDPDGLRGPSQDSHGYSFWHV